MHYPHRKEIHPGAGEYHVTRLVGVESVELALQRIVGPVKGEHYRVAREAVRCQAGHRHRVGLVELAVAISVVADSLADERRGVKGVVEQNLAELVLELQVRASVALLQITVIGEGGLDLDRDHRLHGAPVLRVVGDVQSTNPDIDVLLGFGVNIHPVQYSSEKVSTVLALAKAADFGPEEERLVARVSGRGHVSARELDGVVGSGGGRECIEPEGAHGGAGGCGACSYGAVQVVDTELVGVVLLAVKD